ncbi:MAG: bifunctional glutamate N-acetyltransferase/amino-acid acetyltransferase ArgJ [Planctomycetaceae bacterium]|nr:bifunctional glutamate N-acetyltransferase/amino-acid acetyltransferase ArgJ [Planctomycetaceae bacterium]
MNIPKGYRFAGVYSGVKKDKSRLDLSLLVSNFPATAAGVYTPNLVCGAPVRVDRARTPGTGFQAVVINSGCANACTGERGIREAEEMAALAAATVGAAPDKGLVMSTGVIGEFLPLDKIRAGIAMAKEKLGNDETAMMAAACGMMTTDTHPKTASRQVTLSSGVAVTVAGMCKGAAMIGPNMATMLCVVFTDVMLPPEQAQTLLKSTVDDTFNCISVEGHTSTSDTVLFLANGAAVSETLGGADFEKFAQAFQEVCLELAKAIPSDGEGVTHLVTIDVTGCKDRASAKIIAKTIAEDALVKTAIAGADPNWGRIVSAAGYSGVQFDISKVTLHVNGYELYRDGVPQKFDATAVSDSMWNNRDVAIVLSFGDGNANIRFWTTDLTEEYVRLNADYHT